MEKPGVTQRWVGISEPDMGDHLHRGNLAPTLVDALGLEMVAAPMWLT